MNLLTLVITEGLSNTAGQSHGRGRAELIGLWPKVHILVGTRKEVDLLVKQRLNWVWLGGV